MGTLVEPSWVWPPSEATWTGISGCTKGKNEEGHYVKDSRYTLYCEAFLNGCVHS